MSDTTRSHQYDTLDDILYRTRGDTSAIAAMMDANPHALASPRLQAAIPIRLPAAAAPQPPKRLQLWD